MIKAGTYWKHQDCFDPKRQRTYFWKYSKIVRIDEFPEGRILCETVSLGAYHTHIDMDHKSYTKIVCKEEITREEYLKAINEGVRKALNAL